MDLTTSYEATVPNDVRARYDWCEVRNAASIIAHTNPAEFEDILSVLRGFALDDDRDIIRAGGNESKTAAVLNYGFRSVGWREASYNMKIISELILKAHTIDGTTYPTETVPSTVDSPSYLVDNVKGRIALDVEWHAKDGNLNRDLAAYRSLYDAGIIDGAVMITMTRESLRTMAQALLGADTTKFSTSTTTNLTKVKPLLSRGDAGGCPVLIASICARTV